MMCPAAYYSGRKARKRKRGQCENPNPYMTGAWAWWLAGWNDEDMAP